MDMSIQGLLSKAILEKEYSAHNLFQILRTTGSFKTWKCKDEAARMALEIINLDLTEDETTAQIVHKIPKMITEE